jgi:hypothetical protein
MFSCVVCPLQPSSLCRLNRCKIGWTTPHVSHETTIQSRPPSLCRPLPTVISSAHRWMAVAPAGCSVVETGDVRIAAVRDADRPQRRGAPAGHGRRRPPSSLPKTPLRAIPVPDTCSHPSVWVTIDWIWFSDIPLPAPPPPSLHSAEPPSFRFGVMPSQRHRPSCAGPTMCCCPNNRAPMLGSREAGEGGSSVRRRHIRPPPPSSRTSPWRSSSSRPRRSSLRQPVSARNPTATGRAA